ncbi:hypothetical protein [Mesorhizobium escarrei]|uniref:Uncharacterized protein n=1 Tax=Mesorhizobium escarrei TaxID=666018 RepID=A0ABN8KGI9_9HYPH|nr:hypothetical protein [Mesorhizobium escarrei]CAH2409367.1 hypothetical protein MES5069_830014 [Mesorhizobium escarrei]
MSYDSSRQAGKIEVYEKRGAWVPEGLTAREIIEGAKVLEQDFEVPPYVSRAMVSAVLQRLILGEIL